MTTGAPIRKSLVLDLFAGLGGGSAGFKLRGWDVVTVDNNPRFNCTFTADLLTWRPPADLKPEVVWASPPCTEFSRESMPWCKTGNPPALDLVFAALNLIRELRPRWWVLENVKGAQRWIGRSVMNCGPVHLWGWFPKFKAPAVAGWKEKLSSTAEARRALIPIEVSRAVADAVVGAA